MEAGVPSQAGSPIPSLSNFAVQGKLETNISLRRANTDQGVSTVTPDPCRLVRQVKEVGG